MAPNPRANRPSRADPMGPKCNMPGDAGAEMVPKIWDPNVRGPEDDGESFFLESHPAGGFGGFVPDPVWRARGRTRATVRWRTITTPTTAAADRATARTWSPSIRRRRGARPSITDTIEASVMVMKKVDINA